MNDTRREPVDELGRSKRLLRLMNESECELSRTLWRSFWTGFAITTIACWLGYELGRRECAR